jgi:hypothetical protein
MDENLVGYLLNALEPDARRQAETYLQSSPEARARLELLERAVAPLAADAEGPEPPPGLALATLARVAEHQCRPLPAAPRPTPGQRAGGGGLRWARRADVAAAAALLLVVGGLALPALLKARAVYQRATCANNLRTLWGALEAYSDRTPDGSFPKVEADGPRGVAAVFAADLRDAGVLDPEAAVRCPAAGGGPLPGVGVGDLEAAYRRGPDDFAAAVRDLAGGYAYSLGYRDGGGELVGLRRDSGDLLPILADRPPWGASGNSPNHGGAGQNVLYIGGAARFCTDRTVGVGGDDIFLNLHNQLGAGLRREDTVLAPDGASPGPGPK